MPKKDEERQEEEAVPEESEICDSGNGGGDALYLKKHWLAFVAQDRNVGWYVEVAAIQGDRWDRIQPGTREGKREIAACLSPIADDPLALPSPTSSPSSSQ